MILGFDRYLLFEYLDLWANAARGQAKMEDKTHWDCWLQLQKMPAARLLGILSAHSQGMLDILTLRLERSSFLVGIL